MKKLVIIAVLAALALLAAIKLAPVYRQTMAHRLRRAAEDARAHQRYDEALRLYRLAIQRDPDDLGVLQSCAAFLDEVHRQDVLSVRLRITRLDPGNTAARLDAIETALKLRKLTIARRLLANPTAEMQTFTRYYDLLGWMQMLSFNPAGADAAWVDALEKNPDNKIHAANLDMVRLSSPDASVRDKAFDDLSKLVLQETPPLSALQSLMIFAAQSPKEPGNLDVLLERFRSLVPPANPFYTSYLDALRRWRPDLFKQALSDYLRAAGAAPGIAMTAQGWMVNTRLYGEFLAFRQSLPAPLQTNLQSMLWEAEALFNLKQTDALASLLMQPAWNNAAPLKMAWQERVRRVVQPPADYDTAMRKWSTILGEAGRSDAMLGQLARLAFTWGWQDEYALTLWTISERLPAAAPDALDNLFHLYARAGDASNLRRVVEKQLSLDPENPNLQNNFAFLSFLLGKDTTEAAKISAGLCTRRPNIPLYISTRAFGFLKAGQPEKGIALFKALDVEQLRGTAPGVCYGYLLAAMSDPLASDYLKDAEKWTSFPEEMAILKTARARMQKPHP